MSVRLVEQMRALVDGLAHESGMDDLERRFLVALVALVVRFEHLRQTCTRRPVGEGTGGE